jgi:hypothetical protein
MKQETHAQAATANETVDAIVDEAVRDHAPVRRTFLQVTNDMDESTGSKLAEFVRSTDASALRLYLTAVLKASSEPWDTALPASVWARAMGHDLPMSKSATAGISKAWRRLEDHGLIERSRYRRMAQIRLLREDGSGIAYTHPGEKGGRSNGADDYFKVPAALWTQGPNSEERWFRVLTLPELAVLLIALSLNDSFRLPIEHVPEWYGMSADTAQRGLSGLTRRGLLEVDATTKKAPLSPTGVTTEHRYTLAAPFGPRGRKQKTTGRLR